MIDSASTVTVSVASADPHRIEADLLFVPAFEDERVPDDHVLDRAVG